MVVFSTKNNNNNNKSVYKIPREPFHIINFLDDLNFYKKLYFL